jgi:hypothetical protein
MSLIQVGLVDTTGKIDVDLMHAVAAAFNVQVTRGLPQFWPVQATVRYLPHATQLPVGVWPVQLVKQLPPGEGGFHINKHNQPYAKVIASPDSDEWTIDASHETLEMLVDPNGNKLQASQIHWSHHPSARNPSRRLYLVRQRGSGRGAADLVR